MALFMPLVSLCQELPVNSNQRGRVNGYQTLKHLWKASWISHPTASKSDYGVFLFRRAFQLTTLPAQMEIYVSGDNRYKLYVNGTFVSNGPARGDQLNWNYETLDIAPFLKKGNNLIAAEVVNFGEDRPLAQHTYQTAFLLQAAGAAFDTLNTGQPGWKVMENQAYRPLKIRFSTVNGFYAAGPGDSVSARLYPWGWNKGTEAAAQHAPPSAKWQDAAISNIAVGKGYLYGNGVHLVRREIPMPERKKEALQAVVRASPSSGKATKINGPLALQVKKNSRASFLLDNSVLTVGYPVLSVSNGKNSTIKITYAEALLDTAGNKGNRNEIEGKHIKGYHDSYILDGGKLRNFESLNIRTFRYVQIDVETSDQDLIIHDFYNWFTAYPFEEKAVFTTNLPELKKIWNVAWRTARLCANESYMDCPYYEQLQYIGDTRVQAMISLYVSGDDKLMRNAIRQFGQSMTPEGITQSRYPSNLHQLIPPYSLLWISMIHDYYWYRGDRAFIESFSQGMQSVLAYYAKRVNKNGLVQSLPWWNFTDYAEDFTMGIPDGADNGYSTLISLQYVYALQNASELFSYLGDRHLTDKYNQEAAAIRQSIMAHCYDETKRLLAETPEKKRFSLHTTLFAILTNTIPPDEQATVLTQALQDTEVLEISIYFRYYLSRCLEKTGMQSRYLEGLAPWKTMLNDGLSTFSETEKDTRSDCHAWSASPLFDFLHTVAGIQPLTPEFKTVRINPHFGELENLEVRFPHPQGLIEMSLKKTEGGGVTGFVQLPANLKGQFIYKKQQISLAGERTKIDMP